MLPSLARLPQQPTGAQLPSDKFEATIRFIRGNPDRWSAVFRTEGNVSPDDKFILTQWVVGGFETINEPLSNFANPDYSWWVEMAAAEFKAAMEQLRCSEEYRATVFVNNGPYHIERDELVLTDTSGAKTWTFVVAIAPRE